ncbi:MAG TPA: hypothetical protein VIL23_03905 [Clostridia bacterium]
MILKKIIRALPYVFLACVLVCVPLFVFPNLKKEDAPKSPGVQGIVRMWHIENFEGGSQSRQQFLLRQMIEFEKKNPGLYVSVQTLTKSQALDQIEQGVLPDLVSFGTGVGDIFLNYAQEYQGKLNIRQEFIKAGSQGKKILAVAYMTGGYVIVCNSGLAKSMGIDTNNNLIDNIFREGQIYNKGKSVRYSLVSARENNLPLAAVLKTSAGVFKQNSYFEAQTQFDAYNVFVSQNALMLLGTQRDINRIINRVNQNNMFECDIIYLEGYTDLVQYLAITAQNEETRQKAQMVIEHLTSVTAQYAVSQIGMFSTDGGNYHANEMLKKMQNAINQPIITPNAFISQDAMDHYHELCKRALGGDAQSLKDLKSQLGL